MPTHSPLFKIIICAVLIIVPLENAAQDIESRIADNTRLVRIPRIAAPVELDGFSVEAAWEGIEPFTMTMYRPVFGNEPTERTEILIAYDDKNLYAAGRFFDSEAAKIQEPYRKRDNIGQASDWFWIGLDTFNDNENALVFMTAPSGLRVDYAMFKDAVGDASFNVSWNTFWDVKTVVNEQGWFAEMSIPLSSLRFNESDGAVVMGMVVGRWIARKPEVVLYPAIPNKWGFWSFMKPSKMQDIVLEGVQGSNPLYITPYALAGFSRIYKLNEPETEYERTDKTAHELGLDVKYGLTSNLTVDVTLNTDFAQVEADEQQVNLTRYSLFFPEKRLFFQERSSNFEFNFGENDRLFHSRRIGIYEDESVRIYGGVRLVGRVGPWDVGFINMQTEKIEELPSENFGVMRLRRQIVNQNSYCGAIVTSRLGSDGFWNTAYGIDGILRLFGDNEFSFKWAQTFEDGAENRFFSVDPARININLEKPSYEGLGYNLDFSRAGVAYNPGLGYEQREDYTKFGNSIRYGWVLAEKSRLLRHYAFVDGYWYTRNADGSTESSEVGPGWYFSTKSAYVAQIAVKRSFEDVAEAFDISEDAEVPAGSYTFHSVTATFNTPYSRLTNIEAIFEAGTFYDGRHLSLSASPSANVSSALELSGSYYLDSVEFPDRGEKFTSHRIRLRALAMFNIAHSLTIFAQYSGASHKIITNIRYRYNPREGNDLYIVYDEGLNTDRERKIPVLPRTGNRTLLLKYNYTFNL